MGYEEESARSFPFLRLGSRSKKKNDRSRVIRIIRIIRIILLVLRRISSRTESKSSREETRTVAGELGPEETKKRERKEGKEKKNGNEGTGGESQSAIRSIVDAMIARRAKPTQPHPCRGNDEPTHRCTTFGSFTPAAHSRPLSVPNVVNGVVSFTVLYIHLLSSPERNPTQHQPSPALVSPLREARDICPFSPPRGPPANSCKPTEKPGRDLPRFLLHPAFSLALSLSPPKATFSHHLLPRPVSPLACF